MPDCFTIEDVVYSYCEIFSLNPLSEVWNMDYTDIYGIVTWKIARNKIEFWTPKK